MDASTDAKIYAIATELCSGASDGFTLDLEHFDPAPMSGYAVGGNPRCWEVRVPNIAILGPDVVADAISSYATAALRTGEQYIGGEVYRGGLNLDAPAIFADRDDALDAARRRGERAIFDLNESAVITV